MTPFISAFPPGTVIRKSGESGQWGAVLSSPYHGPNEMLIRCLYRGLTWIVTETMWVQSEWERLAPSGRWENVHGLVDDSVKGDWRDV
jgi:hypothetical protein